MAAPKHLPHSMPPLEYWRSLPGVEMLYSTFNETVRGGPQSHAKTRISLLLRGHTVEIDDRGRQVEAHPMTVHVTPAGMTHAHWIRSPIVTLCADIDEKLLVEGGCQRLLSEPVLFKSGPVITTALRIKSEITASDAASDVILHGLFLQLIGEMGRAQVRRDPGAAPPWLKRACSLIRERCLQNISIEEVSRELDVHPSHLARVFKTHLNQSPGDFLRSQRIAWTARELARTDKPLQQIAEEAGFADASHFARQFRAQVGMRPIEFRRNVTRLR